MCSRCLLPCLQVSKAVFASTTKSQLNLTNQRADESNPTLTYPDISFAVEDFEEAFESLVSLQQAACCVTVTDTKACIAQLCQSSIAYFLFCCMLLAGTMTAAV